MEDLQIISRHPTRQTGDNRDEQGRFMPGVSGNPAGRPPMTVEERIIKKATKEIIEEYRDRLAEALPDLSPVLIKLAQQGDIQAIKELHDRVMGKPLQKSEIDAKITAVSPEKKAEADQAIKNFLEGKHE